MFQMMDTINYNVVCRWEDGPISMNAMITVHGTPDIHHPENDGVVSYFIVFPDKTTVVLDKSVVNAIIDSNDSNWLRAIENDLYIMFYREVASNYVGYYAYCNNNSSLKIQYTA